jgi:hypothetical protein
MSLQRNIKATASESEVAVRIKEALARQLPDLIVETGKNLLYKIEVDALGRLSHAGKATPARGQYAFQTDILISKKAAPLVVIELKVGSFSSHDVMLYSAKAAKHKAIYPYLRYGFVVVGTERLGRRFLTHNDAFDFALAMPNFTALEADLGPTALRQAACAEKLIALTSSARFSLRRFEETIEFVS